MRVRAMRNYDGAWIYSSCYSEDCYILKSEFGVKMHEDNDRQWYISVDKAKRWQTNGDLLTEEIHRWILRHERSLSKSEEKARSGNN